MKARVLAVHDSALAVHACEAARVVEVTLGALAMRELETRHTLWRMNGVPLLFSILERGSDAQGIEGERDHWRKQSVEAR
jgi:hypothetical protein